MATSLVVMTCTNEPVETGLVAEAGVDAGDGALDCVGVLRVAQLRGASFFPIVQRFALNNARARQISRLSELEPSELEEFCDWEACVRTNGYNHACAITDAGVERCRVCEDGGSCDGFPRSRRECVDGARAPGRASCHAGILQECLIQRAIRGFNDQRVTQTCATSREACRGSLAGSLLEEVIAAKQESSQVSVAELLREVEVAEELEPDGGDPLGNTKWWREHLAKWTGGLPIDVSDAGDFEPNDP